jgi:hypothetical protein
MQKRAQQSRCVVTTISDFGERRSWLFDRDDTSARQCSVDEDLKSNSGSPPIYQVIDEIVSVRIYAEIVDLLHLWP